MRARGSESDSVSAVCAWDGVCGDAGAGQVLSPAAGDTSLVSEIGVVLFDSLTIICRSTRTFEAIYAGCIPVFLADRTTFPYQDILDYSLFSITIPETSIHHLDSILAQYSPATLQGLQAHLLKVREVFMYKEGEEWERLGPLFFALVGMALRLPLRYPLESVV